MSYLVRKSDCGSSSYGGNLGVLCAGGLAVAGALGIEGVTAGLVVGSAIFAGGVGAGTFMAAHATASLYLSGFHSIDPMGTLGEGIEGCDICP